MELDIKIKITNLEVGDEYYSFDYEIRGKNFIDAEGSYEGDYSNGMSAKEWREVLEEGEAYKLALETEIA